jgi:Glycine zipper
MCNTRFENVSNLYQPNLARSLQTYKSTRAFSLDTNKREIKKMKKVISTFLMSAILAVGIPALASTANAQTRYCNTNRRESRRIVRNYGNAYSGNRYSNSRTYDSGRPNVYERHRKAFNIGIGTGAGALIGALIGGRTGALIGAAAGAGGGYVVTKKQSPKNYYRFRR